MILAGPIFNFIFAWILAMIVIGSVGIDRPDISGVVDGLPCAEAGLEAGDTLVQVNDKKITVWRDLQLYLALHEGEAVN